MFQVKLGTCGDDVYHNKSMVVDLIKMFSACEVVALLNGESIPYTYDEHGKVIEHCFINETNIMDIRKSFIQGEQRSLER